MRVLFTPYGGGSIAHVVRSLAVAYELERRGHSILFTAPKSKKSFIENAGFEVFGPGHAEVNLNDEHDQGISYFKKNRDRFIDWLGDEIRAAESFKPHIIVNSPSFFGPLASIKLGIPYIAIINAQWLLEFKGLLGLGKSEDYISHRLLRGLAKPIFARQFEKLYMDEIRLFYQRLAIPKIPERRKDLHNANPILVPGIPEFEPIEKTRRSDIHYIGPLFWQGFEQETFEPERLFKDFKKKPFVYVTLGGSIYRKKSYDELITALSRKTEWNILLSLGPNFSRESFDEDRSHLLIKPFVGGLQVCKYADAVINTASHGTVMQALWHGKPVIALPHNIDQATIAARLAELGLGVNLNQISLRDFSHREKYFEKATSLPWDVVIEETEKVLKNRVIREKARHFHHKLKAYEKAEKKAADYVLSYASQ